MPTQQDIIKLQEQSEELVKNLSDLYNQAGSYRDAKEELQKVTDQIVILIETTRQLAEESHQIIKTTNQIGSVKILEKLTEAKELVEKKSKKTMITIISISSVIIILQIVFFLLGKK